MSTRTENIIYWTSLTLLTTICLILTFAIWM